MDFFVSSLITSMRETLEALFVFVTVFSVIRKSNQNGKLIYLSPISGALLGIVVAIGAGIGVNYLGNEFSDDLWFKIVFDTLMLASTTYFIIWMIMENWSSKKIENKVLATSSIAVSSFFMVFISFFREGLETVAFTYEQTSGLGIMTGVMTAIITAILIFMAFNFLKIKHLMMVLMIFLIMATSTLIGKFADDLIYKGPDIYTIPNDSTAMQVVNSFLRGLFGIKTHSTALALSLQIVWDVSLISLVVWKEVKYVRNSK